MISSIHQQQFQSVITHNHQHPSTKPTKKRRKRRKKTLGNVNEANNTSSTSTTTTQVQVQQKTIAKSKQYFQHDNRLGQNSTIHQQTTFSTSCSSSLSTFNEYTRENELLYAEVAKKFKPLNSINKNINNKQTSKAFLKKKLSQRKLKFSQNKKLQKFTVANNPKTKQNRKPAALMQQHCLCSCQKQNKCYNNNNNNSIKHNKSKTAVFCEKSSCASTTATATATTNANTSFKFSENNLPKILELLQNHTPSLLLETLLNNAKILEYNNIEINR